MGDVQNPVPVCGPCPFRVVGAEQVEEYRHRALLCCPAVARQRFLPLLALRSIARGFLAGMKIGGCGFCTGLGMARTPLR